MSYIGEIEITSNKKGKMMYTSNDLPDKSQAIQAILQFLEHNLDKGITDCLKVQSLVDKLEKRPPATDEYTSVDYEKEHINLRATILRSSSLRINNFESKGV